MEVTLIDVADDSDCCPPSAFVLTRQTSDLTLLLGASFLSVTPRPTDSTGELENLSDEAEELFIVLFFGFM